MAGILKGMTMQDFTDNPDYVSRYLAMLADEVALSDGDYTRGVINWVIANGKQILWDINPSMVGILLWSPVLPASAKDTEIPASWNFPGSTKTDEEGNETQMTAGEYFHTAEVEGGFCVRYAAGPATNNTSTRPSWVVMMNQLNRFKSYLSDATGFLTSAEVDAIRVVEEEPI